MHHGKYAYSNVEQLVISAWLLRKKKLRFRSQSDVSPEQRGIAHALASLGFAREPKRYDRLDAAVGQIVLRDIACRLPRLRWRDVRSPSYGRRRGIGIELCGELYLAPQHLFTITWPGQRSTLVGPITYFRVWLPGFDCFVVTASEPTDGPHGYCDFALGSFADVPDWQSLAGEIIYNDWRAQFASWWRRYRAEVCSIGVVPFEFADQLAERAWITEHRVFYSAHPTPKAPRASPVRNVQRSKGSLNAKIIPFHLATDRARIEKSTGEPT